MRPPNSPPKIKRKLSDIYDSPGFNNTIKTGRSTESTKRKGVSYHHVIESSKTTVLRMEGPFRGETAIIKYAKTVKAIEGVKQEHQNGEIVKDDPKFITSGEIHAAPNNSGAVIATNEVGKTDLMTIIENTPESIDHTFCQGVFSLLDDVIKSMEERGIVHRDLKPDNIVRMADGTFKIIDLETMKGEKETVEGVVGTNQFFSLMTYFQFASTANPEKKDFQREVKDMHYDLGSTACLKMLFASMAADNQTATDDKGSATSFFMRTFLPARQALVESLVEGIRSENIDQAIDDFNKKLDHYERVIHGCCLNTKDPSDPLHELLRQAKDTAQIELNYFYDEAEKKLVDDESQAPAHQVATTSTADVSQVQSSPAGPRVFEGRSEQDLNGNHSQSSGAAVAP